MIRTVHGFKPTVPTSCFIDESGIAIGNVMLDEPCSVSFHPSFAGASEYSRLHEDLPGCPARKSGEEWQLVAKRR